MIIIGEKINGSIPSVARALEARDAETLAALARQQEACGADYLDVCAAVRRQEAEPLTWLIDLVQGVSTLPLCVDSPDPQVLVQVMDRCRKPGILNSVSMERNKADVVFPAMAGTDWKCVGLLCERQIPASADQRLAVLDRLLEKAAHYGVRQEQLLIDPMVEMVCTAEEGARVVLEVIRAVKDRCPEAGVVGAISNVSFNLPARAIVNQAFLAMAMAAGLDAAVLDPCCRDLMGTVYAAQVLLGEDPYCVDYLDAFRRDLFGGPNKRRF